MDETSAMDEGGATPSETPKAECSARVETSLAAEEISGGLLGALRPSGIADVAMVIPHPLTLRS